MLLEMEFWLCISDKNQKYLNSCSYTFTSNFLQYKKLLSRLLSSIFTVLKEREWRLRTGLTFKQDL